MLALFLNCLLEKNSTFVFHKDSTVKVRSRKTFKYLCSFNLLFILGSTYEILAKDVIPPSSLATHTRTALLRTKTELVKPASIYKNELLHVVLGGSTEIFLEICPMSHRLPFHCVKQPPVMKRCL